MYGTSLITRRSSRLYLVFVVGPDDFPGDGRGTVVTAAISGRPARGLENRFTAEFGTGEDAPGYPFTYDAGKALHQAAMARGEEGYAAWWAGQGAPLARAMPAAALVATLAREAGLEG